MARGYLYYSTVIQSLNDAMASDSGFARYCIAGQALSAIFRAPLSTFGLLPLLAADTYSGRLSLKVKTLQILPCCLAQS